MRCVLALALAAFMALATPGFAQPQPFPVRPLRVTIPYAAGGVADITMRLVADRLGRRLGQRVVVESLPSAGGIAAARAALGASADGHTLTLLTNGTALSVSLFKNLPYDPVRDFVPISLIGTFDFVVAVASSSPHRTLGDLITTARASPGDLTIGTIAAGSSQNLAATLLTAQAGIDAVTVPFRSTPDLVLGLARGDVGVVIDTYAALRGALQAGSIRALATTGSTRSPGLADVPTAEEDGLAGYEVTSWNGLFAPAGTPPELVSSLEEAVREVLVDPTLVALFADLGIVARASTPAELGARLAADIERWRAVIESRGLARQ